MDIMLNGQVYKLKVGTKIIREEIVDFPTPIRTQSQQRLIDRADISTYEYGDWSLGLGRETINHKIASDQQRLWDAENVDTRHDGYLTLSPQFQQCTIVPSIGELDFLYAWKGQVYAINSGTVAGNVLYAYKYNAPNNRLGSEALAVPSIATSFLKVKDVKPDDNLYILGDMASTQGGGNAIFGIMALATYANTPPAVHVIAEDTLALAPKLGKFNRANPTFGVAYYSRAGALNLYALNGSAGAATLSKTINDVVGTYLSDVITDGVDLYISAPSGLYQYPASVIINTANALEQNCVTQFHNNFILFRNSRQLMIVNQEADPPTVAAIGYDKDDGLASDKMGEPTALCSTWKYLFTAVKGATYSHILAMKQNASWQYYARCPSPGIWIKKLMYSNSPDAIDRLWAQFSDGAIGFFYNPLTNPMTPTNNAAATYAFVPTGEVTFPKNDLGIANINTAFYSLFTKLDPNGPNASDAWYSFDGLVPTTVLGSLPNVNNYSVFPIGSQSANFIQNKFVLVRSDGIPPAANLSPQYRTSILSYLKVPTTRESYTMTIDLDESANDQAVPLESVIDNINTARNSTSPVVFYYGRVGTKNVRVTNPARSEEIVPVDDTFPEEREGLVTIRVAEI